MYIGLKNIQHLFSDHENLLTHSDAAHCLTGWVCLSKDESVYPLTDHMLYVCHYDSALIPKKPPVSLHLLCIVSDESDLTQIAEDFPPDISLLLIRSVQPDQIYSTLHRYFQLQCGIAMFGQTLLEFLAFDNGLHATVEYSFQVFQNPIFVFDSNYNLIAATWKAIERLQIQDDVIEKRHFTQKAFSMANRLNHIHKKVVHSEFPIRAYNDELGYDQLYCAINTQKDLGHIVISAVNRPLNEEDSEFLLLLKKYINEQMKKDSFVRDSHGYNYEFFLKDLLDKKIAVNQTASTHLNYMTENFGKSMLCMVIELAKNIRTLNSPAIRNMLESHFPNIKTLIFNGQLIAILNIPSLQNIPEEYLRTAEQLCKDNELYAGMSNPFSDILQLEEYYNQALRAIELGSSIQNQPSLFCYKDYYMNHLKNIFVQKESSSTFCHPKMKYLMDYDAKHNSELAYTLYMYLTHECNMKSTAEAMRMHRSSLVYRFKKIHSLLGDDYDNYKDRIYMILSYEFKH